METNFPQVSQNTTTEGQHSAVIAYLGQLALSKPSAADMYTDVIILIAHILPADFVWLWELDPDGRHLTLKSSFSLKNSAAVESQIAVQPHSLEELALRSPYPVVVHELNTDMRFQPSSYLQSSGATNGLVVNIGTSERSHGILGAFSKHDHTYSLNDIHFFHSIANILALFLDAKQQEIVTPDDDAGTPILHAGSTPRSVHLEREQQEIQDRLLEGRERERLRLAQELHDSPIQDLYGLMYQMDDLSELLKETSGREIVEELHNTLYRVINNLRTICGELRPSALSPFGLEVAIRDHVEKLHSLNPDLNIHLDLLRDQQALPDSTRLHLFRIYQQALTNVVRHARASDVHVRFRWDDQVANLEVEDNGVGFALPGRWVDLVRQEHFGLAGIAERVESMQGRLDISSTPGKGTTIRVSVPRR